METILQEINSKLSALLTAQPKEPINADALYSRTEAAQLCSVSPDTIDRAKASGALKAVQIGGVPRFWGRDVKAWINSGGKTGRSLATMEVS